MGSIQAFSLCREILEVGHERVDFVFIEVPVFFVELRAEAIWTGTSKRVHLH